MMHDKLPKIFQSGDTKMNKQAESEDCHISEEMFPCLEKCCHKVNTISGVVYEKLCPYCSIWTSLPMGTNLRVISIFECGKCGYGKRCINNKTKKIE